MTRRPTGTIMAPPKPCRTRAATRLEQRIAAAQAIDPAMKTAMARLNTRLAPEAIGHPAAQGNEDGKAEEV